MSCVAVRLLNQYFTLDFMLDCCWQYYYECTVENMAYVHYSLVLWKIKQRLSLFPLRLAHISKCWMRRSVRSPAQYTNHLEYIWNLFEKHFRNEKKVKNTIKRKIPFKEPALFIERCALPFSLSLSIFLRSLLNKSFAVKHTFIRLHIISFSCRSAHCCSV